MKCIHPEPRAYCKRQDGCNDCDDLRNPVPAAQSASNAVLDANHWTPKVGDWFILKASYCDACTDEAPCKKCLKMCNRFVIAADHYGKDFFFGGGWCNRDGGHLLNETYSAVLTTDRSKVNVLRMIHHVSEAIPLTSNIT